MVKRLFAGARARKVLACALAACAMSVAVSASGDDGSAGAASRPGTYDESALTDLRTRLGAEPSTAEPDSEDALPGLSDVPTARAEGGGAVSGLSIALPSGPSTTLGMGESFSPQLSTGIGTYSVPLRLPVARGGVQPRLDLSYSSAGGWGIAGYGWSVGASAISRQTDRGVPTYRDESDWHPEQDKFLFGGMQLVPICIVRGGTCSGAVSSASNDRTLTSEKLPAWAEGWQYFRARVESGFLRVFWSPDHRTWRAQSKDGGNFEFGIPLDGTGYTGALETNPDRSSEIFRWHLVRQYDSEGDVNGASTPAPVNVIQYRYMEDGGTLYLTDIYDTTPAANPTTTDLSTYAHHTALDYEERPDGLVSYRAGWRVAHRLRVRRVSVTSKPFTGSASSSRELVRSYRLHYDPASHRSLLTQVTMSGRCDSPVSEDNDGNLPNFSCPTLPPLTFEYQHVPTSAAPLTDSNGYAFEPFAERVTDLANSPPHSLDDAEAGLADINADGLPDFVLTSPGRFGGDHGVFFNGIDGQGRRGFKPVARMAVEPIGNIDSGVLRFGNSRVAPLDLDGDGFINLVHMAFDRRYHTFAPVFEDGKWRWRGHEIRTASGTNVKIDFTRNGRNIQVMDVNGDGLVDFVYSSPTEIQTFLALGRYPGGGDQFGQGEFTTASTASISNDPIVACAPWSATTVRFSDPDIRVGDVNGDGLPDIVRIRDGQVLYWPGRGNGFWGTGARDDCLGAGFAQDRHILMANPPRFGVTQPGTLLLGDINGDGLADLVEIRARDVDIYLNDNGVGWTARHTIRNTPFRPSASNYVRITDVDGSGSPDILWGRGHEYQYIDLTGGVVPSVLVRAHNGLGMTTDLEYRSSAHLMLEAEAAGAPWQSVAPTVANVLVRTTIRDNLEKVGRPAGAYVTEYGYRDPVYEGRERSFRGFREATVRVLGDATSPTSTQRSVFLLGECPHEMDGTSADVCSTMELWKDNWREALKGLPVVSETFDDAGTYLGTEHTTYELRQLYTGRDLRRVVVPFPVAKDGYLYDTAAFDGTATDVTLADVHVALDDVSHDETAVVRVRASSGTARVQSETFYDDYGNVTDSVRQGCVEGCPNGVDESIAAHSVFELAPGDGSGWLWREVRSHVDGSVHTAPRNELLHQYSATGKLVRTDAILSGTLPLDRFHSTNGRAIAPPPTGASGGVGEATTILVVQNQYDTFGHVERRRGARGRCSEGDVDPLYAQLPVAARVFVGSAGGDGCGTVVLAHTVTYDRGQESVLTSLDATGQPAKFDYDNFGRLVATTYADPSNPGSLAAVPSLRVQYSLPTDASTTPFTQTIVETQDGPDLNTASYHTVKSFTDGLGRTLLSLSQADPTAGDGGDFVVRGVVEYDTKGAPIRACQPWFHSGPADASLLGQAPPTDCTTQVYDAFGRPTTSFGLDGTPRIHLVRHALSQDVFDAADLPGGGREGTHLTTVSDGHGRGVQRTERIRAGMSLEERHTFNEYLPTGEVLRVIQRRHGSPDIVRWLRYDSLGRLVMNAEPNTSVGFNPDPNTDPAAIKAWRYAYSDAGELVGSSDARGCGVNYFYDTAGRPIAEDRSPCEAHHEPYTAPNLTTGDGTEAFYRYDFADPETASIVDDAGTRLDIDTRFLLGRPVSSASLASKGVFSYDALGRSVGIATRVARPGPPATALSGRFTNRWYVRKQVLDALDRVVTGTTGMTVPDLLGPDGTSQTTFAYTKRGALRSIGSSYGTLLQSARYAADGLIERVTLADAAETQRAYSYDQRRRVRATQTFRATAPLWTNPPDGSNYRPPGDREDPTQQLLLEDVDLEYDVVDNIIQITDYRTPDEWPTSAKPVTRKFKYDDLYRLERVTYAHQGTDEPDTWRSPYAAENASPQERPQPVPHQSFSNRITEQTFGYDWLGSPETSNDDTEAFWDRSLGQTARGTPAAGPHQVRAASNRATAPASPRKGDLEVQYDASGNITALAVRRDGECLPIPKSCWQRFAYEWNEVGELIRARRWDIAQGERSRHGYLEQPVPRRSSDAELLYAYSAGGARIIKTAVHQNAAPSYTLYIFASMEIRGARFDQGGPPSQRDYVLDPEKVSVRLPSGIATARVIYTKHDLPSKSSNKQHTFLELGDHIGSTTNVVDRETGELVEHATYMAYGATESDYRPDRWGEYREPYRFTGKEEDIEVGLVYFGARFYSPYLTTWMSPDPVTIHELGSDANPYAYVHGSPIITVDPDGEIAPLVVVGIVVVSALIAGGTNAYVQSQSVGWSNVSWGLSGVLGAAAAGGVAGGVSLGVGTVLAAPAAAALGSVGGAAVAAGGAGAAAGAASYVTAGGLGGATLTWKGLGLSTLGGVAAGSVGGVAGGVVLEAGAGAFVGALAGATGGALTGYSFGLAFGGEATVDGALLALGAGLAGAAATYGVASLGASGPSGGPAPKNGPGARSADVPKSPADAPEFQAAPPRSHESAAAPVTTRGNGVRSVPAETSVEAAPTSGRPQGDARTETGNTGQATRLGVGRVAKGEHHLELRRDVTISGGRGGGRLKSAVGPANSAVRGGAPGRVIVTDSQGRPALDITSDRVKQIVPGRGFDGPKRAPTPAELDLIQEMWRP
jgi:RHS repeat-associated protein